ncbi:SDR family NAD(P)-dependent oxidoreductase [Virgisporangium aliadipatigenens]|nr:glucose 1-dehydrogenase [Virgisporangium aliadipatigenens]
MNDTLHHRTAVVTGAAKGIGAGIATALAAAGAPVVVNYRTDDTAAERVVRNITEAGGRAVAVRADVTRRGEVSALFAAAREAFGPVRVLVNNAGVYTFAPFTDVTEEDYRRQVDTNLWGTLLTMQAMAAQNDIDDGAIINLSTAGTVGHPPYSAMYVATKSAVNSVTLIAAKELAPRGIRVNAIAPSPSDTDGTRAMGFVGSPQADATVAGIPLGRLGTPEDYGPVAVFLASPAARWITGDVLLVSGGQR